MNLLLSQIQIFLPTTTWRISLLWSGVVHLAVLAVGVGWTPETNSVSHPSATPLVITLTLPEQEQQTSVVEIVAESADSAELTAAVTELAQQATEIGRRKRAQHVVQPAENTTSTTVERANQLDQPAPEPAASAQPARPKRQRFQSASIDVAVRVDHQPDFSQNQPPKYPRVAVINRWEGEVILQLHVDASGAVVRVAVAQSSGYAVLDDAAVRAVSQWRGAPARRGSRNVGTVERLPIRFQLPR